MSHNGTANGTDSDPNKALKILIVGAGIGGLTAAIALRQQGHHVEIFERSRFANELGAAIHLSPNANGVLRRFGIFAEDCGAVETEQIRGFTDRGDLKFVDRVKDSAHKWQHRWLLVHRAHLHEALKAAAQAPGKGHPAKLHTSSRVIDLDTHTATVTLENGNAIEGDVVIGADGVHSLTRSKVPGANVKPFSSGRNAFRFLITRKAALDDPDTNAIASDNGSVDMWHGSDRTVVIYPCSRNELLNFVCIHPDDIVPTDSESGWSQKIGKETLLDVYKDFDPAVLKLLNKADPQTLKMWQLLDLDTLPTWVDDKLALLGDAAHPFLPYRASGGAMAIEDAASLAVMLPAGVERRDIPERLKLYEKARHERVTKIQSYTRRSGKGSIPVEEVISFLNYIYGHDEWDHSTQVLRKHLWSLNPHLYWRQPIVFGPMPGPRQDFFGRDRALPSLKATFRTASIRIKTSRTLLQNLFPNDSYSFIDPGTVAFASFSQTTLNNMDWLGGGGYNHLGLYIHGVQYKKVNGDVIKGTYMPILFENLADPIVSGREELGMPKLYSAIDVNIGKNSYHISTSWQGAVWGNFAWQDLEDQDPDTDKGTIGGEADDGILVYRSIPAVGRENKGKAESEYAVFVPHAEESKVIASKVTRVQKTSNASFSIDGLDWKALPTLHHVISRLAEIPVYGVVAAKVVEGEGVPDVSSARRIE